MNVPCRRAGDQRLCCLNVLNTEDHKSLALRKINELAHLLFEALTVVLNGFNSHHLTHISSARGVTDHSGTAADKNNRLVACHLKSLHKAKCHKVTYVK